MVKRTGKWLSDMEARHALVILGTLAIIVFFVSLGAAIGGSYALTIHYVAQSQMIQEQAQVKAAIPECKALVSLDEASKGVRFRSSIPGVPVKNTYGYRFAHRLHAVVEAGGCKIMLRDLEEHKSISQIIDDIENRGKH